MSSHLGSVFVAVYHPSRMLYVKCRITQNARSPPRPVTNCRHHSPFAPHRHYSHLFSYLVNGHEAVVLTDTYLHTDWIHGENQNRKTSRYCCGKVICTVLLYRRLCGSGCSFECGRRAGVSEVKAQHVWWKRSNRRRQGQEEFQKAY